MTYLESRLAAERSVGEMLESRLAAITAEAIQAREQLSELEEVKMAVLEAMQENNLLN